MARSNDLLVKIALAQVVAIVCDVVIVTVTVVTELDTIVIVIVIIVAIIVSYLSPRLIDDIQTTKWFGLCQILSKFIGKTNSSHCVSPGSGSGSGRTGFLRLLLRPLLKYGHYLFGRSCCLLYFRDIESLLGRIGGSSRL